MVLTGCEAVNRAIAESCFCSLPKHSDSESQDEVIHNIARHLAQAGDELDHSIQPTLVRQLAAQFMNGSLSEEVSARLWSVSSSSRTLGKWGRGTHFPLLNQSLSQKVNPALDCPSAWSSQRN